MGTHSPQLHSKHIFTHTRIYMNYMTTYLPHMCSFRKKRLRSERLHFRHACCNNSLFWARLCTCSVGEAECFQLFKLCRGVSFDILLRRGGAIACSVNMVGFWIQQVILVFFNVLMAEQYRIARDLWRLPRSAVTRDGLHEFSKRRWYLRHVCIQTDLKWGCCMEDLGAYTQCTHSYIHVCIQTDLKWGRCMEDLGASSDHGPPYFHGVEEVSLHDNILVCVCIHTYIHTYIHTCAYIHTYFHGV